MGLLTPSNGRVLLDGIDVTRDCERLQSKIAYVPQEPFIMDASVLSNILLDHDNSGADLSLVRSCLDRVQLLEHVDGLEKGIYTEVGPNGSKLSGGQRQRLVIARALYSGRDILVFDEPTSAIDNETEEKIILDLLLKNKGQTVICISHNQKIMKHFSKVLMIEKGKLISTADAPEQNEVSSQ